MGKIIKRNRKTPLFKLWDRILSRISEEDKKGIRFAMRFTTNTMIAAFAMIFVLRILAHYGIYLEPRWFWYLK